MRDFKFDEERHRYTLDGKSITGVTTILGVLSSPWLIQWAADEAVKHLNWFDARYEDPSVQMSKVEQMRRSISQTVQMSKVEQMRRSISQMTTDQFYELLCNARTKYLKKRDKAGDLGTKTHKWIEMFAADPNLPEDPEIAHITRPFVEWVKKENVQFLENELRLYSEKHWYAGTMDLVLLIKGKVWIGDVKTSGGISPRNFFQTAAYQNALQEMGKYPEIEGNIIINTRKNGEFEVQRSYGYDKNLEGFLACLTIYRALEELRLAIEGKK